MNDVHRLARLRLRLEDIPNGGFTFHDNSNSSLVVKVKYKQQLDPLLIELKESVLGNLNVSFYYGVMVFLCTDGDYLYWMLRI